LMTMTSAPSSSGTVPASMAGASASTKMVKDWPAASMVSMRNGVSG
jgi:hypothetical protein